MFLVFAGLSAASAADAPMSRDEMGAKIVTALVDGMGVSAAMADKMAQMALPGIPEDWKPLWKQAALDEITNDHDAICAIKGKTLATKLTEAQLATGVSLVSDPRVVTALVARVKGEGPPAMDKKDEKEVAKKLKSAEAASFVEAMKGAAGDLGGPPEEAVLREVIPGFLKRFGEAAEKAEAAR